MWYFYGRSDRSIVFPRLSGRASKINTVSVTTFKPCKRAAARPAPPCRVRAVARGVGSRLRIRPVGHADALVGKTADLVRAHAVIVEVIAPPRAQVEAPSVAWARDAHGAASLLDVAFLERGALVWAIGIDSKEMIHWERLLRRVGDFGGVAD